MKGMGMITLAAYLLELRTRRRMSRARLAELTGTTEMSILRIETKGQEPSGPLLVRLVGALGASWDAVTQLVDSPDAGSDEERSRIVAALVPDDASSDEEARLNRLIDLLADGVPPDEAARRVLRGQ
jgi:transcriptional regulator with XRE-family HTH domain